MDRGNNPSLFHALQAIAFAKKKCMAMQVQFSIRILVLMGYNFFDHKTTFFGSFLGYILQGKNVLFYLQLIKEYIKDTQFPLKTS